MAAKTILARITREIPTSGGTRFLVGPAINSGESWLVKANLNVADAVMRAVPMAPAVLWGK